MHDRFHRTDLAKRLKDGTVDCAACHGSPRAGTKGEPAIPGLSAAVHGFHAVALAGRQDACSLCHPAAPSGLTAGLRGIHATIEMDCTSCHGSLQDHAAALLEAEQGPAAGRLLALVRRQPAGTDRRLPPRTAWLQGPDCLACHVEFQPPETDTYEADAWAGDEERFGARTDDAGIGCSGCHGPAHGLVPAGNVYGGGRDNLVSLQYQQQPYPLGSNFNCAVCHTQPMGEEIHHPNMLAEFRNTVEEPATRKEAP